MNAYEKEVDEKEFEQMLNDIYGDVSICGMSFQQGSALKELDPTAFRCAMADEPVVWICEECGTEFDNEDIAEECCTPDEEE